MPDPISSTYTVPEEWRMLTSSNIDTRKTGGDMGKHDFLMLLSAQLRYQDPLEPMKDSDFAAQLAQFSALEQMENMNQTLAAMSNYQAFGLAGKLVVASAYVDGVLTNIFGTVDAVFTQDGVTYAQIQGLMVPVSAITDVIDNSNALTPAMLIETSNNLIGRSVKAQYDKKEITGTVTGLFVDDGDLWVRIYDESSGKETAVPIGCIYDIRQSGTAATEEPPEEPPEDPPEDQPVDPPIDPEDL